MMIVVNLGNIRDFHRRIKVYDEGGSTVETCVTGMGWISDDGALSDDEYNQYMKTARDVITRAAEKVGA